MEKKIYGIIGYPVKHSLSPAMHNAAFRELKMDAEYRLFEVAPAQLEEFLGSMGREKKISGLNVTIPHKIKVKEYLERNGSLDTLAARLGAVNTINVSADGASRGFNTDGPGFYRSLVEDLKFEPEGKGVFVLGSGGAAKAIIMYLGNGPKVINVFDIDKEKTEDLKAHYKRYFDEKKLNIVENIKEVKGILGGSDLLINATPIGMKENDPSPLAKDFLRPGLYVYDLVYNRQSTQLVKDASSLKAHAVTGVGMLLYQGTAAFEIWTGKKAPVAIMKTSLREALKEEKKRGN